MHTEQNTDTEDRTMDTVSNHRRDNSFSSVGSALSVDIDAYFDDLGGCAPGSACGVQTMNEYKERHRSTLRPTGKRVGTEMAIIATTSPEIKALNLPITPTFPQVLIYQHLCHQPRERSNSYDSHSSYESSSSTRKTPRKKSDTQRSTPRVGHEDSFQGRPSDSRTAVRTSTADFSADTQDGSLHFQVIPDEALNGTQSLPMCGGDGDNRRNKSIGGDHPKPPRPKVQCDTKSKKIFFDDKENIHPNLLGPVYTSHHQAVPPPLRKQRIPRTPSLSMRPPNIYLPKPSLHRRGSFDNLPSPTEIDHCVKGTPSVVTPESVTVPLSASRHHRRGTIGTGMSIQRTLELSSSGLYRKRLDQRKNHLALPKSLKLSTGFR